MIDGWAMPQTGELLAVVPDEYGAITAIDIAPDGALVADTESGRQFIVRAELLRPRAAMARA